jgi:hypothetical protein
LAREKAAQEEAVVEEQRQSLAMGLSGLKLTITAPASISRMTSGLSTQSKGKRKAMAEEPSTSQCVAFIPFSFLADFLHTADVVRLVPSVEEGMSLGSGGCNGASGS